MASRFCSSGRRQKLEQRHAVISAVLATLADKSKSDAARCDTPEEYYAVFAKNYSRDDLSKFPPQRLGKGLKKLAENKRREDFQKKLEKKNAALVRKLSEASSSSTMSTKSDASSSTLLDSSDDEKGRSTSEDDGAPLELTWTWSALGEAF
ncbi:uncharacterized protein PV09_08661 [Verruconis gallopava]|uniref:Uncharacterized protein n=1 Tax=Verruconis gallopava TaxID=253628 RepID=A0A0D2A087_9PEZI|nr:uncharacterized protein PV09_08661 [Verruconis gallopava]KIV99734.1 hypothetical protein PV09_08661 [Verruconis gallopava]